MYGKKSKSKSKGKISRKRQVKFGAKPTSSFRGKNTFITTKVKEIAKRSVRIQRGPEVFPRNWYAQFKFVESSFIDCVALGGLSSIGYQYSTNNTRDPRYNLAGNQPLWYDQVALYYERLWDHAVKVELTFTNPGIDGMYCGYRVRPITNNVQTSGQTLNYLQQMDLTEIRPINNTGSQTTKFTFFLKNHKLFGISKEAYKDLTYSHTSTGDPSVFGLLEPFAFSTTSDTSIRYDIKIIYYTELTNRITPAES